MPDLQGIFPVIPTLFDDHDRVDPESMKNVVRFALEAGAHGVVFPGVASEYNYLSPQERGELMAVVSEEVAGRVPIIGGASAPTSEEVIIAGRQAEQHGIGNLMIMAPARLGDDLDAHYRFFAEIGETLSSAEIILQNAPTPIGAGLSAEAIVKLAASSRAITYVKEETLPSGPAISAVLRADIPHVGGVFGGGGARYIIDELNRGAIGAIPAVELTDLHVAIYNAHTADEFDRARELYGLSLPLLVAQSVYRMRLTKYVLKQRGIADRLHVRAPLPEFDAYARQDVDAMLADVREQLVVRSD